MIHRFVDVRTIVPDIPILAYDGSYKIWQIGNLATPRGIATTFVTVASGDYLADPQASPVLDEDDIPAEFVYCRVHAGTGGSNEVIVCDWEGTTKTTVAISPANVGSTGKSISLHPSWSPDGSQVVYRDSVFNGATNLDFQSIHVVDRDGSNDTILYTVTNDNFVPHNPLFSYDGSKIAWIEDETYNPTPVTLAHRYRLWVMDVDGSNPVSIVGPLDHMSLSFSWANTALTIAYMTYDGNAATDDQVWRKIDADGTNDAIVWTIDRSGRSMLDYDPEPIKWSWLSDDSAIVTALLDFGGSGLGDLVLVDPAGTGPTTLLADAQANTTGEDMRPVAIGGRIYFPADGDPVSDIESLLEDGTDQRTDLNAETEFQGFRGDNLTP